MTEQEKREKAIAKMIKDSGGGAIGLTEEQIVYAVRQGSFAWFARAYDIGYRKADEVRKETAKEIYKDVLYLRELMVNNDDSLCILRNVESWAKEAGVEVEE